MIGERLGECYQCVQYMATDQRRRLRVNRYGVDIAITSAALFGTASRSVNLKNIGSTTERCVQTDGQPRSGRMGGTSGKYSLFV